MLVLSRKKNERIVIGNDIVITVVEVRGDKCRIGIDAPQHIQVNREEIHRIIAEEERQRNLNKLNKGDQ